MVLVKWAWCGRHGAPNDGPFIWAANEIMAVALGHPGAILAVSEEVGCGGGGGGEITPIRAAYFPSLPRAHLFRPGVIC